MLFDRTPLVLAGLVTAIVSSTALAAPQDTEAHAHQRLKQAEKPHQRQD